MGKDERMIREKYGKEIEARMKEEWLARMEDLDASKRAQLKAALEEKERARKELEIELSGREKAALLEAEAVRKEMEMHDRAAEEALAKLRNERALEKERTEREKARMAE